MRLEFVGRHVGVLIMHFVKSTNKPANKHIFIIASYYIIRIKCHPSRIIYGDNVPLFHHFQHSHRKK